MEKKSLVLSNNNYHLLSDDLLFDKKAKIFSDLYFKKNIEYGNSLPVDHVLLLMVFDFIEAEMDDEERVLFLLKKIS
jgi:hypothetical protein